MTDLKTLWYILLTRRRKAEYEIVKKQKGTGENKKAKHRDTEWGGTHSGAAEREHMLLDLNH